MGWLVLVGIMACGLLISVILLGTTTSRALRRSVGGSRDPALGVTGFPRVYTEARETFLEAVSKAGGRVDHLRHPLPGPGGEDLFLDVALFGAADAPRTLIVCSGTHGVEGYAGSGIQTGLLREGLASSLPPGVSLLLVHAVNPYGMAAGRRVNEDNVDVNRNFLDHDRPPLDPNAGYGRLATAIAPRSLSFWAEVGSWTRLLRFRLVCGKDALQAAASQGQCLDPRGLFFRGTVDAWSNRSVRSIAARFLGGVHTAIVVDIHTGLGNFSEAEMLMHVGADDPEYARAVAIWGPDRVKSTVVGDSVSPPIEGSLKRAFADAANAEATTTAASLEFGTLTPTQVFLAMRAENWLYHHGGSDAARAEPIRQLFRHAFHPNQEAWETAVFVKGKAVIRQALLFLEGSSVGESAGAEDP